MSEFERAVCILYYLYFVRLIEKTSSCTYMHALHSRVEHIPPSFAFACNCTLPQAQAHLQNSIWIE
jgi:hypothetical protein